MSRTPFFPLWKDRSRRNCRQICFEPLEERCLLAMMANWIAVAMPDSVAAEGVSGNTGTWRIWRSGVDDVLCYVDFRIDGATDFTLQTSEGYDITLTSHTEDGVTYQTGMVFLAPDEYEVFLVLTPTNDARREQTESATIQLTGYYSAYSYNIHPQTQTMTIQDNDDWYVSVAATDAVAAESSASNPNYGLYTITRSNETDTTHYLNVRFELTGTASISDYSLFTPSGSSIEIQQTTDPTTQETIYFGFANIPSGSLSTTVELRPNNDAVIEETETAVITLTPQTTSTGFRDYSVTGTSASVSIADNDDWCVSVTATDAIAEEGTEANPNYGVYTFTRSNETDTTHPLSVCFQMSGTAINSDYTLVDSNGLTISLTSTLDPITQTTVYTGVAQIPADFLSTTVELRPVDDHLAERDETATLTIVPNGTYYTIDQDDNSATVTIEESTVVTLTTIDDTALEPCTWISVADRRGAFRLTVETTETDWQQIYVQLDLSGTAQPGNGSTSGDYYLTKNPNGSSPISGSSGQATVMIPAGQSQLDFYAIPNTDLLYEPDETVILEIIQAYSGSSLNQVDYDDSDVEAVEILQAPEFISGNDDLPISVVNSDSYSFQIDKTTAENFITMGYARMAVGAVMADMPSGNPEYSLEDQSGLFRIDKNSGEIFLCEEIPVNTPVTNIYSLTVKSYNPSNSNSYDVATVIVSFGNPEYIELVEYTFTNLIEETPPLADSPLEDEWTTTRFVWYYLFRNNPSTNDEVDLTLADLQDDYRRALIEPNTTNAANWNNMKTVSRVQFADSVWHRNLSSEQRTHVARDFSSPPTGSGGLYSYGNGFTDVVVSSNASFLSRIISFDIDGNEQINDYFSVEVIYHCSVNDLFAEPLNIPDLEPGGTPYKLTGSWDTNVETYTLKVTKTLIELDP